MKQTVRRAICVAGVLSLAMGLTGCGGGTDSADVPEINWYLMKCVDNASSQKMVEDELNQYLTERAGAKLKINLIEPGAWQDRMNVIISSGEEFDICQTGATGATSVLLNSRNGSFIDVTELLDTYGKDIRAKIGDRTFDAIKIDGKIYAIPSQAKYVDEYVFAFKKDLVEKYNFDYKSVKSLADLEPYCEILKANEPDVTPLFITAASNLYEPVQNGGAYCNTDIKFVTFDEQNEKFICDLDIYEPSYRIRNDFYKKGYIARDANVRQEASDGQSGKYAVMCDAGAYTEDGSKSSDYYGFPCVETLLGTSSVINPLSMLNGNAISATSEHPEKAMQILNEIWKDPYLSNTMAYGIEGVDYTVASGTTNEDKTVIPNSGSDRTWTIWHNLVGPLFDQWDSSWNSRESLMQMKENNETTAISATAGFFMDTEGMEAEIAALSQIYTASEVVLRTGCMADYDTYMNDLRAKLDNAGINKLLDELNRQYTAFKSGQ